MGPFLAAAIDTTVDMETMVSDFQQTISQITTSKVFSALITAALCLVVVKMLIKVLDRALSRSRLDAPLQTDRKSVV